MRTTAAFERPISAPGPVSGRRFADVLRELPGRLLETLCRWQARAESRARLAELDDRLLADVGLAREDVLNEARKPFWQA